MDPIDANISQMTARFARPSRPTALNDAHGPSQIPTPRSYQYGISSNPQINIPPTIRHTQSFSRIREQQQAYRNSESARSQLNNSALAQLIRRAMPISNRARQIASMHPSFRSKAVCQIQCGYCDQRICNRGMKAILLADISVELYSTDYISKGCVQLVGEDYITRNCRCRIRDVACLECGNAVGYHVTQPCEVCMNSCNNGHLWMFLSESVNAKERKDQSGNFLIWSQLSDHEKEKGDRALR